MAYKRPLTDAQISCIILLWIILVGWIITRAKIDGMTVTMLIMSGIIVFYPVIKSIRERKKKP